MRQVFCNTHGATSPAFVCQHVADGLSSRVRVGFFFASEDPNNPYPDAWCAQCDERLRLAGGEWEGEAEEQLGARLMCGHCYLTAKTFHTGGNPWS